MYKQLQTVISRFKRLTTSGIPEDKLALECLVKSGSFRLPASASEDRLIGAKTLIKAIIGVWKTKALPRFLHEESDAAIIELTDRYLDLEVKNIDRHTADKIRVYVNKQQIFVPADKGHRVLIMSRILRFGFGLALRCLASKDRSNLAMISVYLLEIASVLYVLEEENIKKVYHFAPYDVDSNLCYFVFRDAGIKMAKFPSPGPLKTHNHILFADELMLSCEYQFDEVKTLPNIQVEKIHKWLPESAFNYIEFYTDTPPTPKAKTLGYYSHASWLRHAQDHADTGVKVEEAEELVLSFLSKFLNEQEEVTLTIFLHPREKAADIIDTARAYYAKHLPEIKFEFSEPKLSTADGFGTVDIGIAAFSTVLYERLFCGYKTLICNHGVDGFPLENATLSSVCFKSFPVMENLIHNALNQSQNEFFESHTLKGYRYFEYPYFSKPNEPS